MEENQQQVSPPGQQPPPPQQYPQPPQQQWVPQQSYQQPQQSTPTSMNSKIMKLVKGDTFGTIVFFGVVLILLGAVMIHIAPQITNYDHDPPSDSRDIADNAATQRMMGYVGSVLADIGIAMVAGFLLLAALFRADYSDTVRFGMLFTVGLMLFAVGFRL